MTTSLTFLVRFYKKKFYFRIFRMVLTKEFRFWNSSFSTNTIKRIGPRVAYYSIQFYLVGWVRFEFFVFSQTYVMVLTSYHKLDWSIPIQGRITQSLVMSRTWKKREKQKGHTYFIQPQRLMEWRRMALLFFYLSNTNNRNLRKRAGRPQVPMSKWKLSKNTKIENL